MTTYWDEWRYLGIAIFAGSAACLAGGGIGARLGAWSAQNAQELLAIVRENPTAWRWTNLLWVGGVPLAASGVVAVGNRLEATASRHVGIAFWMIAAVLGILSFATQSEMTIWAAEQWSSTGSEPSIYSMLQRLNGVVMITFMLMAYVGSILLGVAALSSPGVSRPLAWSAIVGPVFLSPLLLAAIPAGAILLALVFAAMALAL